jgi:predicted dehydrogenase
MTLGWAILGTAGIADRAIAPAIGEVDGAGLVAVLSRDRAPGRRGVPGGRREAGRQLPDPPSPLTEAIALSAREGKTVRLPG